MTEFPQAIRAGAFALIAVGTLGLLANEFVFHWGRSATFWFAASTVVGFAGLGLAYLGRGYKMSSYRETPLALAAGAATGALILGIAGRGATAGVALVTGNAPNLSLRGVSEVVIAGTLVGAIGGVLLLVLRSVRGGARLARGVIVGIVLFACSVLVSWLNGKMAFSGAPTQLLTLIVVVIMFIVYGVCADALLTRFQNGGPQEE